MGLSDLFGFGSSSIDKFVSQHNAKLQNYSSELSQLSEQLRETTDMQKVMEIQDKILSIINKADQLNATILNKKAVYASKTTSSKAVKILAKLTKLEESAKRVNSYSKSLERQIETIQKVLLRQKTQNLLALQAKKGMAAEKRKAISVKRELLSSTYVEPKKIAQQAKSFQPVLSLDTIAKKRIAAIDRELQKTLGDHNLWELDTPTLEATGFSAEVVKRSVELGALRKALTRAEAIEKIASQTDAQPAAQFTNSNIEALYYLELYVQIERHVAPDDAELKAMQATLIEAKEMIGRSFTEKLRLLSNLNPRQIQMLEAMQRGEKPQSDAEKLDWFRESFTLTWNFANPFSVPIYLTDFIEIAEKALSDKGHPLHNLVQGVRGLSTNLSLLRASAFDIAEQSRDADGAIEPAFKVKVKTDYLIQLRERNKAQGKNLTVGIMGAGPGGWARAIVAATKGANVKVVERRETYTRPNVILLGELDSLDMFGIRERLIEAGHMDKGRNKRDPLSATNYMEIQISHLEQVLEGLAREVIGKDATGADVKIQGEVVDIYPAGESGRAGCLYKKSDGTSSSLEADVLVDSTGARGALAMAMMVDKVELSSSQMMIAIVLEKGKSPQDIPTTSFEKCIRLKSDRNDYFLIQPSVEMQERMAKLNRDTQKLNAEMKALPIRSDPKAKEALEAKKAQLAELKNGMQKLLKEASSELKLNDSDIVSIEPFPITISEREAPAQILGNSLVVQSGDSLATPDPKASGGTRHALRGATVFSKALDDLLAEKPLTEVHNSFSAGARSQALELHQLSFKKRGGVETATIAYHVKLLVSMGKLTPTEQRLLHDVEEKRKYHIALTPHERSRLFEIRARLKSSKDEHEKELSTYILMRLIDH